MKIQLKAIKYYRSLSRGTHCYEANLYVNGTNVATVSNDGNGGSDNQELRMYKQTDVQIRRNRQLMTSAKNKISEMLDRDGRKYGAEISANYYSIALERWCADEVADWVILKEMKRSMKTNILFMENNDTIQVTCYKRQGKKLPVTQELIDKFIQEYGKQPFPKPGWKVKILNPLKDVELLHIIRDMSYEEAHENAA